MAKPKKIERPNYFNKTFRKYSVMLFPKKERNFLLMIMVFFMIAMLAVGNTSAAMWVGFLFASYSAIANDSIQTIGTFIASNQDKKWYVLWVFLGGIFLVTVGYSWFMYDGDVSYQRLASKGFEEAPTNFHFLQIAAPIFLIILTRLRMPVSTTFILLTSFATIPKAVGGVLAKSLSGYVLAFFIGIVIYVALAKFFKKVFVGKPKGYWTILQWITSGTLWSVWLMQDAANIAVYLPRNLDTGQFIVFALVIIIGLGFLLYHKGGRIQKIVLEKSQVVDVRYATIIDFVYCIILFYFKLHSKVPMSTTWVFIGLLAGRELGMTIVAVGKNTFGKTFTMIGRDFSFAMIGLIISIVIAVSVNDNLTYSMIFDTLPEEFGKGFVKFFERLFGGGA